MMKLVIVAVIISAAYADDAALICKKGAADAAAADLTDETCGAGVKTCTLPKVLADFTGVSDQKYGCGACDPDPSTTCATCTEAKCNTKVETEEYECAMYAWEETEYKAAAEKTKCTVAKDAKKTCNMPGDEAKKDKDYEIQHKGCGGCKDEQSVTDKKCKTSSAVSMTALLLPLIAAFYTLF